MEISERLAAVEGALAKGVALVVDQAVESAEALEKLEVLAQ